jgi:hypothetical protein
MIHHSTLYAHRDYPCIVHVRLSLFCNWPELPENFYPIPSHEKVREECRLQYSCVYPRSTMVVYLSYEQSVVGSSPIGSNFFDFGPIII